MLVAVAILAVGFAVLRTAAARRERSGLQLYRQSGDVLSLRNNDLWRLLKGFSEWGLLLTGLFLQISLRAYF